MMIEEKIYLNPTTVEKAIEFACRCGNNFRFLAGGTDVMANRFQGNENSSCLIDLSGIEEMKQVVKEDGFLKIGSLVRLDSLEDYQDILDEFPVLIEAAHAVASPVIRKTATLGGNLLCENRCVFYNQSGWWRGAAGLCLKANGVICLATGGTKACFSKLVSDTAPALISMDARIAVALHSGEEQIIPLEDIYTGDGIHPRNLADKAIIKSVWLPLNRIFRSSFRKLRKRESLDFTSLTSCVSVDKDGKLKIALSGVDPKPVVMEAGMKEDIHRLIKQLTIKTRIVNNDVFSRKYRKEMIRVFLEQSFRELKV